MGERSIIATLHATRREEMRCVAVKAGQPAPTISDGLRDLLINYTARVTNRKGAFKPLGSA